MNITIIYPHKRKTKSSTYGIAQMVLDRLLSGGTLHEFYLPQDMPHVCAGCYACMNGREDKCGGHEYMQKLIAAIDDSELIIFCAPTYVYHIPGQVKTLLDHFAYRWLVHRPDLSLMCKQVLIITTAAGGGMKSTVRDLRDSMNYWGVGRTLSRRLSGDTTGAACPRISCTKLSKRWRKRCLPFRKMPEMSRRARRSRDCFICTACSIKSAK